MKNKKVLISVISAALVVVIAAAIIIPVALNRGGPKDTLVVMSEELNGLFSPFFATAGADMDVVGQTQIGMLTTDTNGNPAWGEKEAVVTLNYEMTTTTSGDTVHTFVLKNGIKFSDGHPLTMEDVLFNMYVYLDPVYTGSSTMYSTKIKGLQAYRTQRELSGDTDEDAQLTQTATGRATNRRAELLNLYNNLLSLNGTGEVSEEEMREAISTHNVSNGYRLAVTNDEQISQESLREMLLDDYNTLLTEFKEELGNDYNSAQSSYVDEPYSLHDEFKDPIFCFMYTEGYVEVEWNSDRTDFEKLTPLYGKDVITTREAAIQYIYDDKVAGALNEILLYWASGQNLMNEYVAKAKDVILHAGLEDDELAIKNISGIVSLGHTTDVHTVTVNGTEYTVAHEYNEYGEPVNADEYAVLQITVEGSDPKAVWNFGFTVAPQHYYTIDRDVDIANNEFGVEWGDFDFMRNELQRPEVVGLPMGAGPYVATDAGDSDSPSNTGFYSNNVVYYKANENFLMGTPKIQHFRYQVVSSNNALAALSEGTVHFVTPQYTNDNYDELTGEMKGQAEIMEAWQLGYGYIGINAGKIPNINLRKAIMAAMDATRAISYYRAGTAVRIAWPMSNVSWAYPRIDDGDGNPANDAMDNNNGHDYTMYPKYQGENAEELEKRDAMEKIRKYMDAAGSYSKSDLSVTFTIAGSNLNEHPIYQVFLNARDLLNECGWDVNIEPDINALTKLSTGSLTVWAAAWGSTIDPDMYQVYHKNSTATSVLAWGYREILASPSTYPTENNILNDLSEVIDDARETTDQTERTALYREAMGYVLDLAVEFPVYQRKNLYAYNPNVINSASLPAEVNPYVSPLYRIWEVELVA
mgnify:CR=1 FL=1